MYKLVNHPSFSLFIFIVIGLNTITLSLTIYTLGQGTNELSSLIYFNYVFFTIFTIELIMKLIGLGCREFIKDKFNIFDAVVVIISLVEIIIAGGGNSNYSALRAFRLLRIFKLFRVGDLRILVDCLVKTMKAIFPFVVCLFLFMYIFSLMGMQFFSGKLKFNENDEHDLKGDSVRYNFDTFFEALLSVFIILTGENWNEMMYDAMRATSNAAALYFMLVVVCGNIIIVQLLVAIVITNFDESRKITQKRSIIDGIEAELEEGLSLKEALQTVLGEGFSIEDDQAEDKNEGSPMFKITRNRSISRKMRKKKSYKKLPMKQNYIHANQKGNIREEAKSESDETHHRHKIQVVPQFSDIADDMSVHIATEHIEEKLFAKKPNTEASEKIASKSTNTSTKLLKDKSIACPRFVKDIVIESEEESKEELKLEPQNLYKQIELFQREDQSERENIMPSEHPDTQSNYETDEYAGNSWTAMFPRISQICGYMNNSSLFILPQTTTFRQFLVVLVTTPEDVAIAHKFEKNSLQYGIENVTETQRLGTIRIVEGKIVCDSNLKRFSKIFEFFIITCILLSCIALAIQTPLSNPHTAFNKAIQVFDGIFTFIFLIEAILKVLALGLLWNQLNLIRAYIWNPWNVLDLTVVVMSVIDFFSSVTSDDESSFSGFKALRAIRALRPLRVISRSENLKILIQALFASIPAMGHVLLI